GSVGVDEGHAGQLSGAVVRPAVVAAAEMCGAAAFLVADLPPSMAAHVEQNVNLARGVARHDHGILSHLPGHVIAGVRDLRFVGNEQPALGEEVLQLPAVNVRVVEDPRADVPFVEPQQLPIFTHSRPLSLQALDAQSRYVTGGMVDSSPCARSAASKSARTCGSSSS